MKEQSTDKLASALDELIKRTNPPIVEPERTRMISDGQDNKPSPNLSTPLPYFGSLVAGYNGLIQEIATHANLEEQRQIGTIEKQEMKDQLQIKSARENELKGKNRILRSEIESMSVGWKPIIFLGGLILCYLMARGEWGLLEDAFLVITANVVKANWQAVAMSVMLCVTPHCTELYLARKPRTKIYKLIVRGIVCGVVSLVLLYVSYLRVRYLHELQGGEYESIWPFFLNSYVLFAGIYLVAEFFVIPNFQAVAGSLVALVKEQQILVNDFRTWNLKRQRSAISANGNVVLKDRVQRLMIGQKSVAKVNAIYHKAYADLINENLSHRTDGQIPRAFTQEPPLLNDPFKDLQF